MLNKKGLSQVVTTVILILFSLVLIAGVWSVINNSILKNMEEGQSCFNVIDKIVLNPQYTCYNTSSDQTIVSISLKDIDDLESVLIAITYEDKSEVFEITNKITELVNLTNYPNGSLGVYLPKKESGKTYIVEIAGKPKRIEIAPNAGKKQCDVADYVAPVPTCR